MTEPELPLFLRSLVTLAIAFYGLVLPGVFFIALAVFVKGRQVIEDARRALPETRVTLLLMCFNAVLVAPLLAVVATWMTGFVQQHALSAISPAVWERLPVPIVVFAAIFAGDFIGYWRHRMEHSRLLWPSHAVHHSDTQMTWLALERFHPINRLTTLVVDNAFLLLLGLPPYALVASNVFRHYYGYLVHADLPWTYGRLGRVFVSPAMHRWHHAADTAAYNTNFATVFALFDRWFGTYRVPGLCTSALGVTDRMGSGVLGQLLYPLRPSAYRGLMPKRLRRTAGRVPPVP